MDMIELRRRMLQPHILTFGGLIVGVNDAYYGNGYKRSDEYLSDSRFFLTTVYDTGSETSKSYTMRQYSEDLLGISFYMYVRWFNSMDDNCADYWGNTSTTDNPSRQIDAPGRYIIASVPKLYAGDFYIYDNTNQRYVIKGNNVT